MGMGVDYMTFLILLPGAGRSDSDGSLLCWLLSNELTEILVDTMEAVVLL